MYENDHASKLLASYPYVVAPGCRQPLKGSM
jgi:hypothetical protein